MRILVLVADEVFLRRQTSRSQSRSGARRPIKQAGACIEGVNEVGARPIKQLAGM